MSLRFCFIIFLSMCSSFALAKGNANYEVMITNITRGQTFTPQLLVTHGSKVELFEVGQPASPELEILSESGNTQPLTDFLNSQGRGVGEVKTIAGLLGPGESVVTTIKASRYHQRFISMAAMLIPTNDTFVSLNRVRLPRRGEKVVFLKAYDAGTEVNDQNCVNIPGPRCGGAGFSVDSNDTDEGYVYIGNGFHDLGVDDGVGNEVLGPLVYDWRNPVAQITIRRIH
ncbi:MAG: hypothetical protein ACJATV_001594 [Granulosicoccus sp.]|jgi:hypothetical protein